MDQLDLPARAPERSVGALSVDAKWVADKLSEHGFKMATMRFPLTIRDTSRSVFDELRLASRVAIDRFDRAARRGSVHGGVPQERGAAQDRVKRRTKLVAHRGEKLVFESVCRLGLLPRQSLGLKQTRMVDGLRRTLRKARDERPVGLCELMEAPEHERHGAEGSPLERQRNRRQRVVAIAAILGE